MNRKLADRQGYPVILFVDELFARMHATRRRMWAQAGLYPRVPSHDHHGRQVVYGGLNLRSGRVSHRCHGQWNGVQMLAFLKRLLRAHRYERVLLVWDRAAVHRTKAIRIWLAKHPNVEVCDLPPYCADINPIEHFWGLLRRQVTDNHMFSGLPELTAAIRRFFCGWRLTKRKPRLFRALGMSRASPRIRPQTKRPLMAVANGLRLFPA